MKKIFSIVALIVIVFGCAKKITPTVAIPAKPSTPIVTASNNIAAGQTIYVAKCGRCHGLKNTADFTANNWVGIMNAMAPKAQLNDGEKANVLAYVQANAKK